jgi:hypothetical protein
MEIAPPQYPSFPFIPLIPKQVRRVFLIKPSKKITCQYMRSPKDTPTYLEKYILLPIPAARSISRGNLCGFGVTVHGSILVFLIWMVHANGRTIWWNVHERVKSYQNSRLKNIFILRDVSVHTRVLSRDRQGKKIYMNLDGYVAISSADWARHFKIWNHDI